MNRWLLFLILFLFGVMWGITIPLTKIIVSTGHHPFGLIFWQSLISMVVLKVVTRLRRSQIVFDRQHLFFFATIAFTGTLIPNSTSYLAAFHLPAGVMALIIALVPMFSLMIALTARLEQFQWLRLAGVLLGATAIALIVLPESSLPDPTKAVFVLIALIGPLCYGIEGNYLSVRQPADTGPVATLYGASVIGTVVSLPVTLLTGSFINPFETGIAASELALLGTIMLHIAAYIGYIWMVTAAGAVFAAQIAYIVTPAGILLSMVLLGEQPSAYLWSALAILLLGLFLVQPKEQGGLRPQENKSNQ
jgi:drug/metabolite transporter (DMT)-like permease